MSAADAADWGRNVCDVQWVIMQLVDACWRAEWCAFDLLLVTMLMLLIDAPTTPLDLRHCRSSPLSHNQISRPTNAVRLQWRNWLRSGLGTCDVQCGPMLVLSMLGVYRSPVLFVVTYTMLLQCIRLSLTVF